MAESSWRIVSIQKSIMCLLCMVVAAETVVAVEDVVVLVVVVGLVATGEVALVDEAGRGGNDRSNFINGIDVSDLTQNFMDEEWRKLVYNGGWLYVAQACEQMNGRGCGGHDGSGG
jgi:hypothetical protein